jgi:UDP-N-acetylmuramyl pentapeptide phosphotransferase/UDP-N-acetylglucosamine-1-phosphate transferase
MKNEAVAEVVGGVGMLIGVVLFLVGYAKIVDPTQYSLAAQVPGWAVVLMLILSVFCLLAEDYFRPHPRKPLWREQDFRKLKSRSGRIFF